MLQAVAGGRMILFEAPVAGIMRENVHGEVDFHGPTGKEAL